MTRIFDACARWLSHPWACAFFIGLLIPALGYGFYVHWATDYVLALTLFLSIIPYIVMFTISYSQARDTLANQVQQGELIRAVPGARDELIGLEAKDPAEIERMRVELRESPP